MIMLFILFTNTNKSEKLPFTASNNGSTYVPKLEKTGYGRIYFLKYLVEANKNLYLIKPQNTHT
jgi:hypothetical protein